MNLQKNLSCNPDYDMQFKVALLFSEKEKNMNQNKLSEAGINVEEGIERFGGKQAVYEKFLYRFPKETLFSQMCDYIDKQDIKEAFAAAHSLKGQAGNLSINRLYDDLCPLVEELRCGSLSQAKALLEPVIRDYRDVIAVLTQ